MPTSPMVSQVSQAQIARDLLNEAVSNGGYLASSTGGGAYGDPNYMPPPFIGIDSAGNAVPCYGSGVPMGRGGGSGVNTVAMPMPTRWSENNLTQMLTMRLGWNIDGCPFRKVTPVKLDSDKVAVFVCTGADAVVIEDEAGLYPSDALITQLRLLQEATCAGTTGNVGMQAGSR